MLLRLERTINSRQAYKFFLRDWRSLPDLRSCADVLATMRATRTLEAIELSAPRGKRITIIAPHPDDEMLGAGGTLIHAVASGASVRCIYITSSSPTAQVESEATAVAKHVGYGTEFLRFPVHAIPLSQDSVAQLTRALTSGAGDTIFVPILLDDHEDHRRTNQLLFEAWKTGQLSDSTEVWAYQVYSPTLANVVVDISDVAARKVEAIRLWKSQMQRRKLDHYILGLNAFNTRLLPHAHYVEAFFVVPLRDYCELCSIYFRDPNAAFLSTAYRSTGTDAS